MRHGKTERYIKDDGEYASWLLGIALKQACLRIGSSPDVIEGAALAGLARQCLLAQAALRRLVAKVDRLVLDEVLRGVPLRLDSFDTACESADRLSARLPDALVHVERELGSGRVLLRVTRRHLGNEKRCVITDDLVRSADFQTLARVGSSLTARLPEPFIVTRGEGENRRQRIVRDFPTALDWLLEDAGRAVVRQRYKGLGEMNPQQLWETTMDPDARCMLQVKIEDAVEADRLFSVLMGEDVEPRRAFIERHGVDVFELDI